MYGSQSSERSMTVSPSRRAFSGVVSLAKRPPSTTSGVTSATGASGFACVACPLPARRPTNTMALSSTRRERRLVPSAIQGGSLLQRSLEHVCDREHQEARGRHEQRVLDEERVPCRAVQ